MSRQEKDRSTIDLIREIKSHHPGWGYRFVWAYMRNNLGIFINKKRIYRLMHENNLLVPRDRHLKAKRDNQNNRSKPRANRPNQFWGTDMTKIMLSAFGWIYLVIVLDWYTKKIIGYSVATHSRTEQWLDALHDAVDNQFPQGILNKEQDLSLISDNGSQPTSQKYQQACSVMAINQIFASYSNPKGNADTERVMRTIKEDFIWSNEFHSPFDFVERFKQWVHHYNHERPHSTLGYLTPDKFEKEQFVLTKI